MVERAPDAFHDVDSLWVVKEVVHLATAERKGKEDKKIESNLQSMRYEGSASITK